MFIIALFTDETNTPGIRLQLSDTFLTKKYPKAGTSPISGIYQIYFKLWKISPKL